MLSYFSNLIIIPKSWELDSAPFPVHTYKLVKNTLLGEIEISFKTKMI